MPAGLSGFSEATSSMVYANCTAETANANPSHSLTSGRGCFRVEIASDKKAQ